MSAACVIVKVGGSLYELPDLSVRLLEFLHSHQNRRFLLLPGGGAAADVVRSWDQRHQLGEEAAHWLALRMLQVNAFFLRELVPQARVVARPTDPSPVAILDAFQFAQEDETSPEHLPHRWDVTSDSVAVRAAVKAEARELVLLKSIAWHGADWETAAREGVVDRYFPIALKQAPELHVRIVNLRVFDAQERAV